VTKQVSRPCVGLGMEAFVRRGRVVPIEEAFVRPEKSGVCVPGRMLPASDRRGVGTALSLERRCSDLGGVC
jgi:hypothetical protein